MNTVVQILSVPMCQECDTTVDTLRHLCAEYPVLKIERLNLADWPVILETHGLLLIRVRRTRDPCCRDPMVGWLVSDTFDEWIGNVDRPED